MFYILPTGIHTVVCREKKNRKSEWLCINIHSHFVLFYDIIYGNNRLIFLPLIVKVFFSKKGFGFVYIAIVSVYNIRVQR